MKIIYIALGKCGVLIHGMSEIVEYKVKYKNKLYIISGCCECVKEAIEAIKLGNYLQGGNHEDSKTGN